MSRPWETTRALRLDYFPDRLTRQIEAGRDIAQMIGRSTASSSRPAPSIEEAFPGIDKRYAGIVRATLSVRRALRQSDFMPKLIMHNDTPVGVASWIQDRPTLVEGLSEIDESTKALTKRTITDEEIRSRYHGPDGSEGATQIAYWFDWEFERSLDLDAFIEAHGYIGGHMLNRALTDSDYVWALLTHEEYEPSQGIWYHMAQHGGPNQFVPLDNRQAQHIEGHQSWLHDYVNGQQLTEIIIPVR